MDVPLTNRWVLIPQTSLLHVGAQGEEPATTSFELGGGVGFHATDTLDCEVDLGVAPRSSDVTRATGELGASWSFGGRFAERDAEDDPPHHFALEAALVASRFWFSAPHTNGIDRVTQYHLDASLHLRPVRPLDLTPKTMWFFYDRSLDTAAVTELGVLARVGTRAPSALLGARVTYAASARIAPFLEADDIVYVAGAGHAVELIAGADLTLGSLRLTLGGGALIDRPRYDEEGARTLPVAVLDAAYTF